MTESVTSVAPMAMRDTGDPIPSMVPPEGLRQMKLWRGDEFTFADLIDFINPLQHIPIISTIYSHLTGETPGALARFTIGGLIGGPIGLLSAAVNSALITETGRDMGQIAMATITGESKNDSAPAETMPQAIMAHASDRGRDYAADRAMGESSQAANATQVVAYNAGDSMSRTERAFAGMSDRGSEPIWDRIPSVSGATSVMAARANDPAPMNVAQPGPIVPQKTAGKTTTAEAGLANSGPQKIAQSNAASRKGALQGPQLAAPQMAAQLSASQGIASRSTMSNAARQEPSHRVPGHPTGVALPVTPNSTFSNSMSDALDKYEALTKSRNENTSQINLTN